MMQKLRIRAGSVAPGSSVVGTIILVSQVRAASIVPCRDHDAPGVCSGPYRTFRAITVPRRPTHGSMASQAGQSPAAVGHRTLEEQGSQSRQATPGLRLVGDIPPILLGAAGVGLVEIERLDRVEE